MFELLNKLVRLLFVSLLLLLLEERREAAKLIANICEAAAVPTEVGSSLSLTGLEASRGTSVEQAENEEAADDVADEEDDVDLSGLV